MWSLADPVVLVGMGLAAIVTAGRALVVARTPQGALGWVLIIALMPPLGVPLYLVFGQSPRRFAREARQEAQRLTTSAPGDEPASCAACARLSPFERLSGLPASRGNGADLLIDGAETYDALFAAIASARRYLLVQFYIVRQDECGERLKAALIERAKAGVRVYLLQDSFRGVGLPRRWSREMRAAGIEVRASRGPHRLLGRLQFNFRNHRKVVLVDGRDAYIGGFNIGEEYLGRDPRLTPWRDTHLRLRGPMIARIQEEFAIDWLWSSGNDLRDGFTDDHPTDPRDMHGIVLAPSPIERLETGNLHFCAVAAVARRRLWIATPYFVPDIDVLSALKLAAIRGVDVRILVPDMADHRLPWLAAFTYFDDIRHAGGEIYRFQPGFMHSKVVLVDDDLASIGTLNLDIRSGLVNFEETAVIADTRFAGQVASMLEADFARSRRMTRNLREQPLWLRAGAQVARLVAPLL